MSPPAISGTNAIDAAITMLRAIFCLTLLSAASALVLPVVSVRAVRTAVRAASPLMADDCIVDAENAAEIAACSDDSMPQTAAPLTTDDCIVEAENAAEIAACSDVGPPKTGVPIAAASVVGVPPPGGGWTSVPFEECIVDAENAAEIAACSEDAPVGGTPPPGGGYTSVPYEECIVDAENIMEIAACADVK